LGVYVSLVTATDSHSFRCNKYKVGK
jgi:hypothetical protein